MNIQLENCPRTKKKIVVFKFFSTITKTVFLSFLLVALFKADIISASNSNLNAIPDPPHIIYVKANATGSNNGNSWANAYTKLQDALANTYTGSNQIWVAKGTYYPDEGGGQTNNNRSASFVMKNNVAIYGGFLGNESQLSQRNFISNRTNLSGDLNQNDGNIYNAGFINYGENSYHVIKSTGNNATAILDGFFIESGNASGNGDNSKGAGMYSSNSTMHINNCTFHFNAANEGGGLYAYQSSLWIVNCLFQSNKVGLGGGGVIINNCNPFFYNSIFQANYVGTTSPDGGGGGGTVITYGAAPQFINCTFSGNNAKTGGAIYNIHNSQPIFYNTIVWSNLSVNGIVNSDNTSGISYYNCLVQNLDLSGSNNNLNANTISGAIFEFYDNPAIAPQRTGILSLATCSPVIDKGNNGYLANPTDIAGNPRFVNGTVDLGAYEAQNVVIYTYYRDFDQDGYGDPTISIQACSQPTGYVDNNLDCDDNDALVRPGHGEYCTGKDNDCNGIIDDVYTFYKDADNDGLGNPFAQSYSCTNNVPTGYVTNSNDCNDSDPTNTVPIIYVNKTAPGPIHDGSSWNNAFTDLQTALSLNCPQINQIWVAKGTYYPTEGTGSTSRGQSFVLRNNLAIYGGFTGNESVLSQRNPKTNITTLSGDINQDGAPSGNSYHVIFNRNNNLDNTAVLDGFHIKDGNAKGYNNIDNPEPYEAGSGMYNENSYPKVVNCVFENNSSETKGGAVYNARLDTSRTTRFINCIFKNNSSVYGGAIYNDEANINLTNCLFYSNSVQNSGGAIYTEGGNSFKSNIINCTFYGNTAPGTGKDFYTKASNSNNRVIANSIFWGNNSPIAELNYGSINVTYSIVQQASGVFGGTGNLNTNPLFVNAASGNFDLSASSPAIGAGSNAAYTNAGGNLISDLDLIGRSRLSGDIIDMGAFEKYTVPNDNCAGAITLECGQPISGNTFDAGPSGLNAQCGPYMSLSALDVWYSFVADGNSTYTITVSTSASDWDGVLFVYSGDCDNLVYKTCADDASPPYGGTETITLEVAPAGTYLVRTFGYFGPSSYTIELTCTNFCPSGNVLYVNANATGENNGSSWTDAFIDLQDALSLTCDNVDQIWVAADTYYPDQGGGNSPGDRKATFSLKNNLTIYGGFAGTESELSDRNIADNLTLLSGDIGEAGVFSDNTYNVVTCPGTDNTSRIDGFTITGGNATGSDFANTRGGGIHIGNNSTAIISNCIIRGNHAAFGGGVYTRDATNPTIINCLISGNTASSGGGGICNSTLGSSIVINSTVAGNTKQGILNYATTSSSIVKNCIVWGNETGIGGFGSSTVSNSIVQGGGYTTNGNLNTDPLFTAPLSSPGLNIGGDYSLQPNSPAINAGSNQDYADAGGDTANDVDLSGNPRLNAGIIDMGAYEYQNTPPTAICQDISIQLNSEGNVTILPSQVDAGSNDLEGTITLNINKSSFDCSDIGSNTVILIVTDESGLTATCSANVIVEDNIAPTIICPEDATIIIASGENSAVYNYELQVEDNCGASSGELVVNGDATDGLNGWNITQNGGNGWAITGGNKFITSFEMCKKSQTIDLISRGYSAATLDTSPDIVVSEDYVGASPIYSDIYFFKAELRNENGIVLKSYSTGNITCTNTVQTVSHIFSDYPAGARYLFIEHGGKDAEYWAGRYGAAMGNTRAEVKAFRINQTAGLPSGSAFPIGTTTNTFEVLDADGNMSTCSFDVTLSHPASGSLNGSVTWNLACGVRNATVKLYEPGTDTEAASYAVSIQSDGSFYIPELEIGTFDIIVKVVGYLAKGTRNVEITAGNNSLQVGTIRFGDLNGANVINFLDAGALSQAYFTSTGNPNYNPIADFDCNGAINFLDAGALSQSYFKEGDKAPLVEP